MKNSYAAIRAKINGDETQSDKFDGMERPNVRCRIRKAIYSSHIIAFHNRRGLTHLAGVDLLTAEGVVVGTHLDRCRCADGVGLALRWLSKIVDRGDAADPIVVRALAKVRHVTRSALSGSSYR